MIRECDGCGSEFKAKRKDNRYCTRLCKSRAWKRNNKERVRTYNAEWRKRNPEYGRDWKRKNPQRKRAYRHARKTSGTLLVRDWRRLCNRYGNKCAYCESMEPLTVDHIIPVTRGGLHTIGNVLPACLSCNSSKGRKFIVEWKY
ncbi:HNH endonuclease [Klebsiella pneumoniae]|nr:HNH endonuclease [Klebsiella pneumoniae]